MPVFQCFTRDIKVAGEASSSPLSLAAAAHTVLSTSIDQEQTCTLDWYRNWNSQQREEFLKFLVEKVVPAKVSTLLDAMASFDTSMEHQAPNIFTCQMRLLDQRFRAWNDQQRNIFLHRLESLDPAFVQRLDAEVAATSGQP